MRSWFTTKHKHKIRKIKQNAYFDCKFMIIELARNSTNCLKYNIWNTQIFLAIKFIDNSFCPKVFVTYVYMFMFLYKIIKGKNNMFRSYVKLSDHFLSFIYAKKLWVGLFANAYLRNHFATIFVTKRIT